MKHRRNSVLMKQKSMEDQTVQMAAERARFEAEMAEARAQLEAARKAAEDAEIRSQAAIKARDEVSDELTVRSRAVAHANEQVMAAKQKAEEEKAMRLKAEDLRAEALAREVGWESLNSVTSPPHHFAAPSSRRSAPLLYLCRLPSKLE